MVRPGQPYSSLPFHPVIRSWFAQRYGHPTEVQREAWPAIARGEHVLACAPTGSGKTLAAFLWAIDRLMTSAWDGSCLRVLYVSPLKALNNDVRRNLLTPLAQLRVALDAASLPVPDIRVATRSGDTQAQQRRQMLRSPPQILITTPESLNILLTSKGGRGLLSTLKTVILDEIHAVAGSKRGVHLLTAVERVVHLSGEVQRIALSATVRPLERIAELCGGFSLTRKDGQPSYQRRPVTIIHAAPTKTYDLQVCPIPTPDAESVPGGSGAPVWRGLAEAFCERIAANRSTLVFTNSRRMAEKLTRLINDCANEDVAYAHHGSLSREVRALVEGRLKSGRLAAIVATNSLELGIDIGHLDEVLLLEAPRSIASAIQRLGRAGHSVGQTSRGRFYSAHPRDLLEAAVLVPAVLEGAIEDVEPPKGALDLLAQIILSMTATESWELDALYELLRCSVPYHELQRSHFDRIVRMLEGRYGETRQRALRARLRVDRVDHTVRAKDGVAHLVYTAGGTIPDRGYFQLRMADSGARIGELDEEFVWERSTGDTFVLGAQAWRIDSITDSDVRVHPESKPSAMAPFWRAEAQDRSFHVAERVGLFLQQIDGRLDDAAQGAELLQELQGRHRLQRQAAEQLIDYLQRQKKTTGTCLPHRHHLLIEYCASPGATPGCKQVVLHTLFGGQVNRPLALALAAAWEERYNTALAVTVAEDCLALTLSHEIDAHLLFDLLPTTRIESLLRRKLEHSGFFGARFRENAGRALLLPRGGWRRRLPLWLTRLNSKKLQSAVSKYGDFPIVEETWRTCLVDCFDIASLSMVLSELHSGAIAVSEAHTKSPSPFAADALWQQTNLAIYEDDRPNDGQPSRLRESLVREVVFNAHLRPRISKEVIADLLAKLHCTAPGYAPKDASGLVDWVKERVLLSSTEWSEMLESIGRDHNVDTTALLGQAQARIVVLELPTKAGQQAICSVERLPELLAALQLTADAVVFSSLCAPGGSPSPETMAAITTVLRNASQDSEPGGAARQLAMLVAEWLQYYGPLRPEAIAERFWLEPETVTRLIESLADTQQVICDLVSAGAERAEVCDAENLEALLRITRARARPTLKPYPAQALTLFLATHHGLGQQVAGKNALPGVLEQLLGFAAPAAAWERDILPARLPSYASAWLDDLLRDTELQWVGCGPRTLTFLFPPEIDLLLLRPTDEDVTSARLAELFPGGRGRFTLAEVVQHSGRSSGEVSQLLWDLAWRGLASNDTFAAVRQGLASRFRPDKADTGQARRPGGRGGRLRWQATRPFAGHWYGYWIGTGTGTGSHAPRDALDEEEAAKERARLLLDRYGVVFRELLSRELDALRWSSLFRALRLMELSGEVVVGQFFEGFLGPQFASHRAHRILQGGLDERRIYWLCANDPVSPCGLGIQASSHDLPRRSPTTHLVYRGSELLVVSRQRARQLQVYARADDSNLPDYFRFLEVMLTRTVDPMTSIAIDHINGEPALSSPYREALGELFSLSSGPKGIYLEKP